MIFIVGCLEGSIIDVRSSLQKCRPHCIAIIRHFIRSYGLVKARHMAVRVLHLSRVEAVLGLQVLER